jgi:hypothetical protein
MNIGTRRSDEVFTELGALVIAGLGTWTGGVRAAVLVGAAIGAERAGCVTVELMGAVGVCNVGAVAPAQLVKTNASAVAPARQRAVYRRGCLTWIYSNEPVTANGSNLRHDGVVTQAQEIPGRRPLAPR